MGQKLKVFDMNKIINRSIATTLFLASCGAAVADQTNISGIASARLGNIDRDGMADGRDSSFNYDAGNYTLFLTGDVNLDGGYRAGFSCVTAAATAHGAQAAYTASSVPVDHTWDNVFTGREDFGIDGEGGFASYAANANDTGGPFCNDEVKAYLATPYGTISVGHIMHLFRNLYDSATVDPFYGGQHAYYQAHDLRANSVRYGNAFGDFSLDVQLNIDSQGEQASEDEATEGTVLAALLAYEGESFNVGVAASSADAAWTGTRFTNVEGIAQYDDSYGAFLKTSIGPVGVGFTYFNSSISWFDTGEKLRDFEDFRIKFTYPVRKWNFIAILGREVEKGGFASGTAVGSPVYTWRDGTTTTSIEIERTEIDLYAQYQLGRGVNTYVRLHQIEKDYSSPDNAALNEDSTGRAIEVGFQVSW